MRHICAFLLLLVSPAFADVVTTDRTYHVSVTGNDANDCLSAANACRYGQTAILKLGGLHINPGVTVTIQFGSGSHGPRSGDIDVMLLSQPWTGPGAVRIKGDTVTPGNVALVSGNQGSALRCRGGGINPASLAIPGPIFFEGFDVSAPAGWGLRSSCRGVISVGNTVWRVGGNAHIGVEIWGAQIAQHGDVSFLGSADHALFADAGQILWSGSNTYMGAQPTFAVSTVIAMHGGYLLNYGAWNSSAYGRRFVVRSGSTIRIGGGASTQAQADAIFPGSIAGTVTDGFYSWQ